MILYYTKSEKTKIFAESIHEIYPMPLYKLESDINKRGTLSFFFTALIRTITNKPEPVSNMPDVAMPEEIFVCSPIWGGNLAAPVKYFLSNAKLNNTRVNLILTASTPVPGYEKNAHKYLQKIDCIVGDMYLFATDSKIMPDKSIITEQMRELLKQPLQ